MVPCRILDVLEQSRGWRPEGDLGVLGLWKLRPENKWKARKGPDLSPKSFVDEKGSWIQETYHPMGGAPAVSVDPLLDPSTMLGSMGWSSVSFFGILLTTPGNVNARNIVNL